MKKTIIKMSKKLVALAIILLMAFALTACDGGGALLRVGNASTSAPASSASTNAPVTDSQQSQDTVTDDIKARMAGFWRLDYSNIYNADIKILFDDGRWSSPGPLPTDHVNGGSYEIVGEESGIYQIRFTVDYSSWPHAERGHALDNFFYDTQNDLLFTVFSSGEGDSNVGYIREHDVAPFNVEMFDAGFALLEHESYGFVRYAMPYEEVIAFLGPPDSENEPEYWSADGLYHWNLYYGSMMQVHFVNETAQMEGARVFSILTSTYYLEQTARGIQLGSTREAVLEAYADVINTEDSRSNKIVAGSVYGGVIFFMDHDDKVEWIFIGASTEYAMLG